MDKSEFVWFEGKAGMKKLPADTPARMDGKMFPISEAAPYNDIEVHDHAWVPGMVVDPPKEMVFEVRLMVPSHAKPYEVGPQLLQACFKVSDILTAQFTHKEGT